MGTRHGPSRRVIWMGAVVAGLVLALAVPAIALGALNPMTFYSYRPGSGSTTTNNRPTISVTAYDGYGVRGSTMYSATLDGISVRPSIKYYAGYGYKKFTLSYTPGSVLSSGRHKFGVSVKDLKGRRYGTSWSFTVQGDTTAPVTTASSATYPGLSLITLSATDSGSGVAHTYYRLDGAAAKEGTLVVVDSTGTHTLEYWSVDKAGNVEAHHTLTSTVVGSHASPALSCTVAGCHVGDIATVHIAKGCAMCHANGVTPQSNCIDCHGANPHTTVGHVAIPSVPASGQPSCTQAVCHGTVVVAIHANDCALCHNSSDPVVQEAVESGNATCETCHINAHTPNFDAIHPIPAGSHTIAGTCAGSTCHGPDVSRMHTIDFRGTGDPPPGCWACHGAGITPSTNCSNCHADTVTPHNQTAAHAAFQQTVGGTTSTACVACHGSDLMNVLPAGNPVSGVQEHVGCTCHAYADVRGATECASCHEGVHAAHGFDNGPLGHKTTTYGGLGMLSKYDGSQGITLTTQVTASHPTETVVENDWALPTKDVFWSANSTEAPATAIKGLTYTSVITCQDCHTGLNLAGPHGANDNMGIDRNYPYPYKYGILGSGGGSTNPSVTVPATSTAGIPASASGIKARIRAASPTGTLDTSDYLNYPAGQGGLYIADATTGQYAIICAKCHDLFNAEPGYRVNATTTVDSGWGNAGPDSYEGMHGAHAGGTARNGNDVGRLDGRSDCLNCHIAIPHGWNRPRLMVNGYTGTYFIGGGWIGGVLNPGIANNSVADPFPYFQGRGQPFAAGVGAMAPAPAVSPGNGPTSADDQHDLNAFGVPVWEEAACISCSQAATGNALEHRGLTTEPAKLK